MDSINSSSRRDTLHEKIENAQAKLRKAASAAVIQNDPLSEQLRALAISIGALGDIYDASEDTQLEIANILKTQTELVTRESVAKVHASGMAIIDQLTPRLVGVVEQATRANIKTLRARTLVLCSAGLAVAVLFAAWMGFSAGEATGLANGEVTAQTISAAMAAGPGAASAWASLMADNDTVRALSVCKKSVSVANDGRHYCSLPIWLDHRNPPT
jgi:hypothetical protein